jgi:hypothetical protein
MNKINSKVYQKSVIFRITALPLLLIVENFENERTNFLRDVGTAYQVITIISRIIKNSAFPLRKTQDLNIYFTSTRIKPYFFKCLAE